MPSSAVAKGATLKPELRLAQSISEFEADLSDEHKREFQSDRREFHSKPPGLSDVMELTAQIDRRAVEQNGGGQCFGPRLTNILQAVQQYAALGDVIIGGTQNIIACGIWSLFRLTLLALVSFSSSMEKLSKLLMVAGRKAPRYEQLALLYPQSSDLQSCLSEYFIVLVQLCHQLHKSMRKPTLVSYFPFLGDLDLKEHEANMQQWADCIKDEVTLLTARKITGHGKVLGKISRNSDRQSHNEHLRNRFRIMEACSRFDHQTTWKEIRKSGNSTMLAQIDQYPIWKARTSSSTLICTGNLGFGKSVLLACMVDELNLSTKSTDTAVIYFFCRHDIHESLRARTIIGSIARQLINANLCQLPNKSIDTNSISDLDDLLVFLSGIIRKEKAAFLVLDGLHECENHERDMTLRCLKRLQDAFTFKICCSFRSGVKLNEVEFAGTPLYSQLPETNPDISTFVIAELERCIESGRLCINDPTLVSEIQEALVDRAQGMFLWTILQIASLCNALSDEEIRESLEDMPKGLPEIFSRILQKCRGAGEKYQEVVFQLCLVARRPLRVEELREALSVVPYDIEWNPARLINSISSVLLLCGGLITIDEEELTVRFLHHSVKQYLLGEFDLVGKPILTLEDANQTMGKVVLTYLNYNTFETALSTTVLTQMKAQDMPSKIVKSTFRHSSTPVRQLASRVLKRGLSYEHDLSSTLIRARSATSQNVQFHFRGYAQTYWLQHVKGVLGHQDTKPFELLMTMLEKGRVNINDNDDIGETLLFEAVDSASCEVVKRLVDYGSDPHTVNEDGFTALHVAAARGSVEIVTWLLSLGADSGQRSKDGWTAASIAAISGHLSVLQSLVDRGANIENRDIGHATPLMMAAVEGQNIIAEFLLERGASITAVDQNGWTALHYAASEGYNDVAHTLLGRNANIEAASKEGHTPLILAVSNGHETVVRSLMARGASITTKASDGSSALKLAVKNGNDVIIYLLLGYAEPQVELKTSDKIVSSSSPQLTTQHEARQAGAAPPFHQSQSEENVKHTSQIQRNSDLGSKILRKIDLFWAIDNGNEMLSEYLIDFGADTEVKDGHGTTPLLRAIANGHVSTAKLLLDKNANVDAKNKDGKTALHFSAEKGYLDLVQLLLSKGAKVVCAVDGSTALHLSTQRRYTDVTQCLLQDCANINARRRDSKTVLHISAEMGDQNIVQLLLRNGADKNCQTSTGRTALHLSAVWGHLQVVTCLLDNGADMSIKAIDGKTALSLATQHGNVVVAQCLLSRGAPSN